MKNIMHPVVMDPVVMHCSVRLWGTSESTSTWHNNHERFTCFRLMTTTPACMPRSPLAACRGASQIYISCIDHFEATRPPDFAILSRSY